MKALAGLLLATLGWVPAAAGEYVTVPAGRFESVLPQGPLPSVAAPVEIRSFALRTAPVTVAEYLAFVKAQPSWQRHRVAPIFAGKRYLIDWAAPSNPGPTVPARAAVVNVSWFAAKAYCESEGARLPTWLEWEYAAAADETRTDARSDPAWQRRILAWYERPLRRPPDAVGGAPNVYGVRDLHGLAWEWVDDFNALFIAGDSRTQGDPDLLKFCGAGAISIVGRDSYAVLMRIALLSSLNAADTTGALGFRCVRPVLEATP